MVDIQPRESWGAPEPRWMLKLQLPVTAVFISYTYTSPCFSPKACHQELQFLEKHTTRIGKCPTVRYNFLIGGDSLIYEGRGWYSRPGLPPKYKMYNRRSIYIGFIGLFRDYSPSDRMYEAHEDLIKFGVEYSLIAQKHLLFTIKPAGRGSLTEMF